MKQVKKRLINILNKQMLIDKKLINENALLEKNLAINNQEFNLLLYYCERDMKINIPDGQINLSQNVNEFASSIYNIKKLNSNKLLKAC
jgi:hypothetical protein